MRVTTAFNRILGLPGTVVGSVVLPAGGRDRAAAAVRDLVCPCGRVSRAGYDGSVRRWRHLDFGACKVILQADIRRVDCRGCGPVRTEWMPWARPGARHTTRFRGHGRLAGPADVQDRGRGVDGHLVAGRRRHRQPARRRTPRERPLDGLYRIGVDEIAYKKGRKFLTVVADHDTGNVVWIGEGRARPPSTSSTTLSAPTAPHRSRQCRWTWARIYREATRTALPEATICFDPFHVIKWAGEALDQSTGPAPRDLSPSRSTASPPPRPGAKSAPPYAPPPKTSTPPARPIIDQLRRTTPAAPRLATQRTPPRPLPQQSTPARRRRLPENLVRQRRHRSDITAFITLARRIRRNFDGIIAAVHTRTIQLPPRRPQRRNPPHPTPRPRIRQPRQPHQMIYLCHGGVPTRLPTAAHRNYEN